MREQQILVNRTSFSLTKHIFFDIIVAENEKIQQKGFSHEGLDHSAPVFHGLRTVGAQFIIATHSPILLGCPNSQILSFDNGKILPCDYENTLSYKITKGFLFNKERMLKELLDD